MNKNRIAAVIILLQAIIVPTLTGSLAGSDRNRVILLQAILGLLFVAVFVEKKWARWVALIIMAVQIPVVETQQITWRIVAGSSVSVGLVTSEPILDSRFALNLFTGYVFNGAILHPPVQKQLTGDQGVTGAYMLNFASVPALALLVARRKLNVGIGLRKD